MLSVEHLDSTETIMSREELESEIFKFTNLNECTVKRIEQYEQQLYDMKRELSTSNAMEEYLSSEIELFHSADKSSSCKLTKKVGELEAEIHILKQRNIENIECYESQLHEKQLEIQTCKETLKAKNNSSVKVDQGIIQQCTNEIVELESKIEELIPGVTDSELKYTTVMEQNNLLENKITELSQEMSELKECLNIKREVLQTNKELAQSLQEETVLLQMEVDNLKNVPLAKATKGNSLFAEVYDNRLKLKKHTQIVNQKYTDLKLKYANKSQELKKLHADYELLTKTIEVKNNLNEDQSQLIESYKKDFDSLSENIKQLEKELELRNATSNKNMTREMKCTEEMISITRKDVLKLHKELYSDSLARVTCEENLYEAKKELMKYQTDAVQLRINALMLNQTIEELKLRKTSTGTNVADDEATGSEKNESDSKDGKLTQLYTQMCYWDNSLCASSEEKSATEKEDQPKKKEEKFIKRENNLHFTEKSAKREIVGKIDTKSIVENKENQIDTKPIVENKENQTDKNTEQTKKNVQSLTRKLKRVNFSENTVEPRTTDRSRRRVITVPCVHIPSIKKE